ncbi:hypothetical protein GCM10012275_58410 [Longimycelium tulufanense]|uniref:Uncharacterized protein n=1 Tax=Longimycelium tulufanense TaxID=907463 RepID=A0A8J3CK93_9PSEU|nr:hypothetical protein GCM10012275_58410 [Longimycelium tulufanense]
MTAVQGVGRDAAAHVALAGLFVTPHLLTESVVDRKVRTGRDMSLRDRTAAPAITTKMGGPFSNRVERSEPARPKPARPGAATTAPIPIAANPATTTPIMPQLERAFESLRTEPPGPVIN